MSEQIEQFEQAIKNQEKDIQTYEALNRLSENKDFQMIIDKGYFQEMSVNLVMQKAALAMQDTDNQRDILRGIDAIGYLRQHFYNITAAGRKAINTVEVLQAEIDAIRSEEAQELVEESQALEADLNNYVD